MGEKLVFATNNKNKLKEVKSMVTADFEILSLNDINCFEEIKETELTLEGNSKLKANFISQHYGYNCFADDTGLEVEYLQGKPGVFSARYAGEKATSEENLVKLLTEMQGVSNRKAQFRTIITLNLNNSQYLFEGVCKGIISDKKEGQEGFGYDPIFIPDGFDKTFAEMSIHDKSKISHRGIAMTKLIKFLNDFQSE